MSTCSNIKRLKAVSLALLTLFASGSAFAASSVTCTPDEDNGYFTEEVKVQIVSPTSIKINDAVLTVDTAYRPRYATTFKRYEGDTDTATQWQDSGATEVFFNGSSKLKFTVRGEMYISESFKCE